MLDDYSDVLTVEEVMELLRMSRGSVYQLLKQGELHSFRNGRIWRIPLESVRKFLMKHSGA